MTLGQTPRHSDLLKGTASFVAGRVGDDSIWSVLHRECHRLFPDELFADLFTSTGRRSVPPELAADAYACLGVLDGRVLDVEVCEAAELLATVVGQDLETGDDGRFQVARRVAKDRVISTVDPDARHGRKTPPLTPTSQVEKYLPKSRKLDFSHGALRRRS